MNGKEAVGTRFLENMRVKGIKANEMANLAGGTPSTVYSMLDSHRREVILFSF